MFPSTLLTISLLGAPSTANHQPAQPLTTLVAPAPAATLASALSLDRRYEPTEPVAAAAATPDVPSGAEIALLWGTFGIADSEVLFEAGLEYRFTERNLFDVIDLQPILGVSLLADGGTYAYAGARHEAYFTDRLFFAPSFAVGIYQEGGVDLGGPLEFRSGLDVGMRVSDDVEIAVGIYHLSNGGIYSINGGSESALFSLAYGL